jgi:predicted signal transduction protein with EAL and GGDEF domain
MDIEGEPLTVTASIGIAQDLPEIIDPKHILTHADIALYHTKRNGRNGCSFYSPAMENGEPQENGRADEQALNLRTRRDTGDAALA